MRDSQPSPPSATLGHNGGPPLEEEHPDSAASWRHYCWKKAHAAAWKTPPREIALRRLARAEELGMTYREYTAVILETGKHL
jgi:hypothetical protein